MNAVVAKLVARECCGLFGVVSSLASLRWFGRPRAPTQALLLFNSYPPSTSGGRLLSSSLPPSPFLSYISLHTFLLSSAFSSTFFHFSISYFSLNSTFLSSFLLFISNAGRDLILLAFACLASHACIRPRPNSKAEIQYSATQKRPASLSPHRHSRSKPGCRTSSRRFLRFRL